MRTWFGFVLAFIAAGALVGAIKFGGGIGGYITAALFAVAAWRVWSAPKGRTAPERAPQAPTGRPWER